MNGLRRYAAGLGRFFGFGQTERREQELEDELRFHIEMQTEENLRRGMSSEEARRQAVLLFGGVEGHKEASRDLRPGRAFDGAARDIRHAARSLATQPLFTITTLLTFALGIGATTVAYSLVHTVLLSPLPYPEPGRLAFVQQVVPEIADQYPVVGVNARSFLRWDASCQASCDGLAVFESDRATHTDTGEPEGLIGARVSPGFFGLLGIVPLHGRLFAEAETTLGADRVIILTHGLWQRRFGGDPAIIGSIIDLDGVPSEVVGVLSSTFHFPQVAHRDLSRRISNAPEYFRPLAWSNSRRNSWGEYDAAVLLRVSKGVSLEAARAELASLTDAEFADAPIHPYPVIEPLAGVITSEARRPLWLLLGVVLSTLLIACVNVANLLGTRWMRRRRELAIRTAIGAGRARLASLVAAESLLITGAGGLLGAGVAWLALDAILRHVPLAIPRLDNVRLDITSFAFAMGLTGGCALLCALLPAWRAASVDPGDMLKAGAHTTTDSGRWAGARRFLVGAEVAVTTMLLVVGGLLLVSFINVLRVDPGFSTTSVVAADLVLPSARYPDSGARARFFDQVLTELDHMPGIEAAGLARGLPLENEGAVDAIIPGGNLQPIGEQAVASHVQVSPGYFRAIGLSLVHGRLFTPDDRGRHVAVISEHTARTVWPSPQEALGRTFTRSPGDVTWEVVGVVADVRLRGLEHEAGLAAYVPYGPEDARPEVSLVIKSQADVVPAVAIGRVRDVVRAIDSQLPLQRARTLDDVVDGTLALRRFQLRLVIGFATTGLLLACIGIYGVSASAVERRRGEIAVRLAFGATPGRVRRLVARQGLTPAVFGLTIGLVLGVGAARIIASMLFGVTPTQPAVVGAVALTMLLAAIVASLEPAARAARTPIVSTLRGA